MTSKIDLFLDMMFHSADQTHLWHLQTDSYALHKALDDYYTGIRAGLDDVAEKAMGMLQKRLSATGKPNLVDFKDTAQVMKHLEMVCKYLTDLNSEITKKYPQATHIVNAIDVIRELVAQTKYLITLK